MATFWGLNNTGIDMFLCSFIVLNGPTATRFCPSLNLLRFNFNIFLQFYWLPLWWHFCPLYHQYLEPEIFNMPLFIEIYLWWWNLKTCIMFSLFITKENILSAFLGPRINQVLTKVTPPLTQNHVFNTSHKSNTHEIINFWNYLDNASPSGD